MTTIYEKIKKDHEKARRLISEIENIESLDGKKKLFSELKKELIAHAEAEEKTLYKKMKKQGDEELVEKAEHSIEEHESIEDKIENLEDDKINIETWNEKFNDLTKYLAHHMDEEEDEVFDAAKDAFSKNEAEKIGERMKDQKSQEKEKVIKKEK